MDPIAAVAEQFVSAAAEDFPTSPLYQALKPIVARQPAILELLTHRRAGQQAPYLFFGAVHHLLLGGCQHPLREFFPLSWATRRELPVPPAPRWSTSVTPTGMT